MTIFRVLTSFQKNSKLKYNEIWNKWSKWHKIFKNLINLFIISILSLIFLPFIWNSIEIPSDYFNMFIIIFWIILGAMIMSLTLIIALVIYRRKYNQFLTDQLEQDLFNGTKEGLQEAHSSINDPVFCINCRAKITNNLKYCPKCGKKQE